MTESHGYQPNVMPDADDEQKYAIDPELKEQTDERAALAEIAIAVWDDSRDGPKGMLKWEALPGLVRQLRDECKRARESIGILQAEREDLKADDAILERTVAQSRVVNELDKKDDRRAALRDTILAVDQLMERVEKLEAGK
jgi:hypothetical protein